ncbi:MAG: type II toxin-antitoxin system PemK/MazF family toxin [Caulobacteraceae bacterium]|nr:type II toxin-antitoxin system PemK/MazF family toxin [Caulobacteraceae bacterium]
MDRGSLILAALPGDIGKVRPALVIQSAAYPDTSAVVVLPLTSDVEGPPGPRVELSPTAENGLRSLSRVMVDKIGIVRRSKVGPPIGRLSRNDMAEIDRALTLFLGIGGR